MLRGQQRTGSDLTVPGRRCQSRSGPRWRHHIARPQVLYQSSAQTDPNCTKSPECSGCGTSGTATTRNGGTASFKEVGKLVDQVRMNLKLMGSASTPESSFHLSSPDSGAGFIVSAHYSTPSQPTWLVYGDVNITLQCQFQVLLPDAVTITANLHTRAIRVRATEPHCCAKPLHACFWSTSHASEMANVGESFASACAQAKCLSKAVMSSRWSEPMKTAAFPRPPLTAFRALNVLATL